MHLLLTDLLTCPRCGPEHGLLVLADTLQGRRVDAGRLGCANCREEFPIRGGLADLRAGAALPATVPPAAPPPEERAYRVAALLAVGHGPGNVLLLGASDALAAEVDRLLPNAQVIVGGSDESLEGGTGRRVLLGARLPFRSGSLRGVAVVDAWSEEVLAEAARVLARGSHLVADPAPPEAGPALRAVGLEPLLEQEGVAVASTS